MLQYINHLPDHIVGIHAKGDVTADDYENVLKPRLDELVQRQGEIDFLLVLQTDVSNFTLGAWWKDLTLGLKNFTKWRKIAIVSDQKGVEWFSNAFTHFIPGKSKGFSLSQLDEAVTWISQIDETTKK